MNRKRVLVIEKNDILREKIAGVLSRWSSDVVVTIGSGCEDVESLVTETQPNMLIIDIRACGAGGAFAGALKREAPGMRILLLADENDENYQKACSEKGADMLIAREAFGREKNSVMELLMANAV